MPATRTASGKIKPKAGNGKPPATLAAAIANTNAVVLKIGDKSFEAASVLGASGIYLLEKYAATTGEKLSADFPAGYLYQNGLGIGTIQNSGRVVDAKGVELVPAAVWTAPAADVPAQVTVGESVAVELQAHHLAALLAIAPTNEVRVMLNGVYVHQLENGELRFVATDGHRLLLLSFEGKAPIAWAAKGLIIPSAALNRIAKFIGGKADASIALAFAENDKSLTVTESTGLASFTVPLGEGNYPDYQRVLDSASTVFTAERKSMETAGLQTKYLQSAGAIGSKLAATSVQPFVGEEDGQPTVFTFGGAPEAMLLIMGITAKSPGLAAPAARKFGKVAIADMVIRLQAQIAISKNNAKTTKQAHFAEQSTRKAERLQARLDELLAATTPRIAGPVESTPPAAERTELKGATTN